VIRGGPDLAGDGLPWPTGPQALLVKACVGPDDQVEDAFRAWRDQINIDDHVDGGTYRLLPLLYQRLRDLGIDDALMGRLKGVYRRSWVESHALFADVAPTVAKLEAAGVKTLTLKGVSLALGYYRNFATRPMMDLDLVVPSEQRDLALQVLEGAGWTPGSIVADNEAPDQHGRDFRNAAGRELDLHWHCLRETPSADADAWFWASTRPLVFEGVATRQLGPTPMLLHLILHGVRSNEEPPIRWIVDAATVIRADPEAVDWDNLIAFAQTHKVSHRLFLGLNYLATDYGVAIPPRVLQALNSSGVSLVERIENIVYLGPAETIHRPTLYPVLDYWRYLRHQSGWSFLRGYGPYLCRRLGHDHWMQLPIEVVRAVARRMVRPVLGSRT